MNATPEMNHPSRRLSRFLAPMGISESLTLALGGVVFLVLLVGGTSFALAFRIHKDNDAVAREYSHILILDQVHSILDDLIFELQQMDATGSFDRTDDVDAMHQDLTQHLDLFERFHEEENETPQANREGLNGPHS